jgi:hypothetical protein
MGQNRKKKKKKTAIATAAAAVAARTVAAAAILLRPTRLSGQEDSGTLLSYTTFRCRGNN